MEFDDGWHPMLRAGEMKGAVAQEVKSEAAARGKANLEVVVRSIFQMNDPARARERLATYKNAGATYVILDLGRYEGFRAVHARGEKSWLRLRQRRRVRPFRATAVRFTPAAAVHSYILTDLHEGLARPP
jgi:hypothetical protein